MQRDAENRGSIQPRLTIPVVIISQEYLKVKSRFMAVFHRFAEICVSGNTDFEKQLEIKNQNNLMPHRLNSINTMIRAAL